MRNWCRFAERGAASEQTRVLCGLTRGLSRFAITPESDALDCCVDVDVSEACAGSSDDDWTSSVDESFYPRPLRHNDSQLAPRRTCIRAGKSNHPQLVVLHKLKQAQMRLDISIACDRHPTQTGDDGYPLAILRGGILYGARFADLSLDLSARVARIGAVGAQRTHCVR